MDQLAYTDADTGYSLSGEAAPPTTHTHPHAALCILLRVMVLEACRGLIINHNGDFYEFTKFLPIGTACPSEYVVNLRSVADK